MASTNSILDERFAIVDVETTGGNASRDRITEIAVIVMENWIEQSRWSSLVNPERYIPEYIQSLTGITNDMVAGAPGFSEVAEQVMELLDGRIFVAHNVRFDYGFIHNALRRAEVRYTAPMLCTVKLSRALYPGVRRHNLDSVMHRHGLSCDDRHRAMGDADVLLQFLQKMHSEHDTLQLQRVFERVVGRPTLPPKLSMEDIDDLPDTPGVYLFYDEDGTCLYVGKSKAIRTRVLSHFSSDYRVGREMELAQQTARVETVRTAGELGALLKEINLVREVGPVYNRRLRAYDKAWSIRWSPLKEPVMHPEVVSSDSFTGNDDHDLFGLFRNAGQAKRRLSKLAAERELCLRTLGLEEGEGPCFAYQVGRCTGTCIGEESAMEHKIRIMQALLPLKLEKWPFEGTVAFHEMSPDGESADAHVFRDWRYLGTVDSESALDEAVFREAGKFDIDIYNVITRQLGKARNGLKVIEITNGKHTDKA